jgi:hypothetical protein
MKTIFLNTLIKTKYYNFNITKTPFLHLIRIYMIKNINNEIQILDGELTKKTHFH